MSSNSATTDDADVDQELVDRANRIAKASADPVAKRDALNPFDDGPATLLDAANELARNFMAGERDGFYTFDDHHAEWLRLINDERKLVLNCHRDGLKTSVMLSYLALRLEYDAGFQAIWAMNNDTMAARKADSEFNKVVRRNPWLVNLQEANRDRDTITVKEFGHGSSLRSAWLDGGIDGDRAHLIAFDDLVKVRGDGAPSDVREWIEGSALPMLKDNGRVVFIGTRKREDDIYQHYRSLPAYSTAEYPAILEYWDTCYQNDDDVERRRPDESFYSEVTNPWDVDDTLRVLWPEARGPDWLARKRDTMADFRFWREYSLAFIGGSGNLVDRDDVNRRVDDGGCSYRGRTRPSTYEPTGDERVIVGHDPAQSPTGDNAAFLVQLVAQDGTREILYARSEKGMKPSEIKAELETLNDAYNPSMIVVEDNGMQAYVRNDAIETSPELRAKIRGMPMTSKKHSWENGIPRLQTLVENGSLRLYRGDAGTEMFVNAALSLELDNGKLVGHTPDIIAAWYMAERGPEDLDDDDDDGDSFLITT